MYTYALLEKDCFYLVEEKEHDPLSLIQVRVVTHSAMFVVRYGNDTLMEWKRKTDPIHDIVELLDDRMLKEWSNAYFNSEDAYYEEGDED